MITSAEEFKKLHESELKEEFKRSVHEEASIEVWRDVMHKFPDLAFSVAQNKTVPIKILKELSRNSNARVRSMVARKRKITEEIINVLKVDKDESVRHALMYNKTLTTEQKMAIKTDDSDWLKEELNKNVK